MYNKPGRISQMIDVLRERNGASIRDLAQEFMVSEMTIRRDLERLRQDNIISLVHGAAIYKSYNLDFEEGVNIAEKERIGKAAAKRIQPDDTIIIDIGTTTEQMVRHIPQNFSISALCFTMNSLVEIHKKSIKSLIIGGGSFHPDTQLFESPETIELIRRTRAAKFFVSTAGINRKQELTTVNFYEVGVKQTCIQHADQKFLLVDSTKFDKVKSAYFAHLSDINVVITDDGIQEEWVHILEDMGIEVEIV
ncbi:MAG: DeoR/GlpR family DNA-binding transcription regulator [Treponema sp.]|jgi:DeoR family deoxyribose operon repressor|nr:DeoR/GlpR family DNA-binding transcription regulator [Treponema sp.]